MADYLARAAVCNLFRRRISRRSVLVWAGRGAASAPLFLMLGCGRRFPWPPTPGSPFEPKVLNLREWSLLAAVQDHLIPSSPESPGAAECEATRYLDLALTGSDVDTEDSFTIRAGVVALGNLSEQSYGKPFEKIQFAEREALLRALEEDEAGEQWLSLLMSFTLEAYLGDPIYVGNRESKVWEWLDQQAGFPRPSITSIEKRR